MKRLILILVLASFSQGYGQLNNVMNKDSSEVLPLAIDEQTDLDAAFFNSMKQNIVSLTTAIQNRAFNDYDYASLSAAVTAAVDSGRALVISAAHTISANTTFSGNTTLIFNPGALITVTSGDTLTINVPLNAGDYQIFAGAGIVRFKTYFPPRIYVNWFDSAANLSTDASSAIIKAIKSLGRPPGENQQNPTEIYFSGNYAVTDSISVDVNLTNLQISHLVLSAPQTINARDQDVNTYPGAFIDATGLSVNKSLFEIRGNGNNGAQTVVIKNLRIDGHTSAGSGNIINAHSLRSLELKNLNIEGAANNAINIDGSKGVVQHLIIDDCRIAQRTGEAYRAGSYGIADSAGINQFNMNRVSISLWDRNVWHKGGSPNSTLPWRWDYVFAISAGKESVYIEDRGDNTYINCAFESSGQTDTLAAEIKLVNALGGYFLNTFIGSDANNDTAAVVLDSCFNISFVNTLQWDNTTGDALLRIIGGDEIRISNSRMTSGGASGIILDLDSSGDAPTNVQIINNNIAVPAFPILLNSFGSETLSNSVITGNILESSANNAPISGFADIDSSSLVINPLAQSSTNIYNVPNFHDAIVVANELAVGGDVQSGIELKITNSIPQTLWNESDAGSNEKFWEIRIDGGKASWKVVNDAFDGDADFMTIDRTAIVVDSVKFPNGAISVGGTATNGVGSFTADSLFQDATKLAAPAYVFESEYMEDMPSIEQVEKYYLKNKELPTMGEENKKSINIGRMNMQLLETIERMQIYISELNKRLKKLEIN